MAMKLVRDFSSREMELASVVFKQSREWVNPIYIRRAETRDWCCVRHEITIDSRFAVHRSEARSSDPDLASYAIRRKHAFALKIQHRCPSCPSIDCAPGIK